MNISQDIVRTSFSDYAFDDLLEDLSAEIQLRNYLITRISNIDNIHQRQELLGKIDISFQFYKIIEFCNLNSCAELISYDHLGRGFYAGSICCLSGSGFLSGRYCIFKADGFRPFVFFRANDHRCSATGTGHVGHRRGVIRMISIGNDGTGKDRIIMVQLIFALLLFCLSFRLVAYDHQSLAVDFIDYEAGTIKQQRGQQKPFLLVFSAQWCFWCHEFHEKSLQDPRVFQFLNQRFVNVFIDADIHTAAYRKYRATGLPYTVFLNPDGSIYYKYGGTLYADDFLEVIKKVEADIVAGRSLLQSGEVDLSYEPPDEFDPQDLIDLDSFYQDELLTNFDAEYAGLGNGQKAVYPRAFAYLLNSPDRERRELATQRVALAMQAAIDKIYDAEEGGFFRYAENRDWGIPHYEKMADLNAGAVLLLYQLHQLTGAPQFKAAADKTLHYLGTALYDPEIGSFLSFQEADESYYFLNVRNRKNTAAPPVAKKIFVDRLAPTLTFLMASLDSRADESLSHKVQSSLDFLARMILQDELIFHYYDIATGKWRRQADLRDLAYLAETLNKAHKQFNNKRYLQAARKLARESKTRFYSPEAGVFTDPAVGSEEDIEYQMKLNALLLGLWLDGIMESPDADTANGIVSYYSGIGNIFEERVFDADYWDFSENYAPYLLAVRHFIGSGE